MEVHPINLSVLPGSNMMEELLPATKRPTAEVCDATMPHSTTKAKHKKSSVLKMAFA
jgi:hypothetical protein